MALRLCMGHEAQLGLQAVWLLGFRAGICRCPRNTCQVARTQEATPAGRVSSSRGCFVTVFVVWSTSNSTVRTNQNLQTPHRSSMQRAFRWPKSPVVDRAAGQYSVDASNRGMRQNAGFSLQAKSGTNPDFDSHLKKLRAPDKCSLVPLLVLLVQLRLSPTCRWGGTDHPEVSTPAGVLRLALQQF